MINYRKLLSGLITFTVCGMFITLVACSETEEEKQARKSAEIAENMKRPAAKFHQGDFVSIIGNKEGIIYEDAQWDNHFNVWQYNVFYICEGQGTRHDLMYESMLKPYTEPTITKDVVITDTIYNRYEYTAKVGNVKMIQARLLNTLLKLHSFKGEAIEDVRIDVSYSSKAVLRQLNTIDSMLQVDIQEFAKDIEVVN